MALDRAWRDLGPGDHIYTSRGISTEIHHGIYEGDGMVIHFKCDYKRELHGVVSSKLDQFLSGGELNVFEYDVNPVFFLAKSGGNTCTTASADSTEDVLRRARFLLKNSSADYHPYIKTCYHFAIYCKTGLIMFTGINVGRNKPAASTLIVTAFVFFFLLRLMRTSFTALAATGLGVYSTCKLAHDIGAHPHFIKVEVERLAKVESLASHSLGRTVRFLCKLFEIALICALISLTLSMWSKTRPLVWGLAGIKFLCWPLLHRTFKFRWVFSNKLIKKKDLRLGDHIYTWRNGYSYAHHGIYVDKGMVIHLTRGEGPVISSLSPLSQIISGGDQQSIPDGRDRVEICSIDTFLSGGNIYLYDYGVDLAYFIAKSRGGTCTLAHSDPPGHVLHRASFLVEKSFGSYNLFYNNCEDFAIYCKTGLLVPRIITLGLSGQTTSAVALICALIKFPYSLLTSNFVGVAALGYVLYSIWRLFSDTGYRGHARKVAVQELAAFHKFIDFMFKQLVFSLLPKFLCYAILICTFLFPGASWAIWSQNRLLEWIITGTLLWALFF